MRAAFKEWAIIVEALGRGDQILILRKGGIAEGRGGFQLQHRAFWLFPTWFHAQKDGVLEAAQTRWDRLLEERRTESEVAIQFAAVVSRAWQIESWAAAQRLRGQHLWREEVIAERFAWGKMEGVFALALKVRRLRAPVVLPMSPAYGGCKSWIELDREVEASDAVPVLSDGDYARKERAIEDSVGAEASVCLESGPVESSFTSAAAPNFQ